MEFAVDEVEIVATDAPLIHRRSEAFPSWFEVRTNPPQHGNKLGEAVAYVFTEADALFFSYAPEMRNLLFKAIAGEDIKESARQLFVGTQLNRVIRELPETPLDVLEDIEEAYLMKDLYILHQGEMIEVEGFLAGPNLVALTFIGSEGDPCTVQTGNTGTLTFGAMIYPWGAAPTSYNLQLFKGNKK